MKEFQTTNEILKLAVAHLTNKESFSRQFAKSTPRVNKYPIFKYENDSQLIQDVANYVTPFSKHYISDPYFGLWDYYTHPKTLIYMMENNKWNYSNDCDDISSLAYALLKNSGFLDKNMEVVAIFPNLLNPANLTKAHDILVIKWNNGQGDINGKQWYATIDTNGLHWHLIEPQDNYKQKIMKYFDGLYDTVYTDYIEHGYPFED